MLQPDAKDHESQLNGSEVKVQSVRSAMQDALDTENMFVHPCRDTITLAKFQPQTENLDTEGFLYR